MKLTWNWGAAVATIYSTFAAATIGLVYFAVGHPAPLVTEHYYRDAIGHDRRIEATANARDAGTDISIETTQAGAPVAILRIPAADARAAGGTVTWYRASDISFDRTMPLDVDAGGVQRMALGDLPTGHWRVKVEWEASGRPFYFERAVMVRP